MPDLDPEAYEERAAILQYDAGLSRERAEAAAATWYAGEWQAAITAAKDREAAWRLIQAAPEPMRETLIRHAKTVFAVRRFQDRKKAGKAGKIR